MGLYAEPRVLDRWLAKGQDVERPRLVVATELPLENLTISLPNRPRLLSIAAPNVFFDRKGGQLISIQINEEPVTQVQALDRLRCLAKEWGWPWNEADQTRWMKRTAQNDRSSIGAGDRWNSSLVPCIGAGIYPAAGTPDRPWYVRISINWPESLPPPYGTAK